ncbi:XkdX family protein [Paenibacillus sp. SC116]|nr:XkdX family protein [Paenibacillus sp. SC116]MCR8843071.1 XkdX family protein [Paenibacillus sp. SC116]
MIFWKLAFDMRWIDATNLRKAVKTTANVHGEITPIEYKTITGAAY